MRKLIVTASVVAMLALAGGLWAQGDVPQPPPAQGGQNMQGGQGAQGGHGMRGGRQGMGQGQGQRPEMGPMQMLDMVLMAAVSPWAVGDAEAQQLLDKVIAARKQVMKDEQDRLAAYEKVVAAARAGNKDTVETARQSLRDVSEKLREDMKAMGDAGGALGEKLRAIRPEGAGVGAGDDQAQGDQNQGGRNKAGKGEGRRQGGQGGAKKDGM